MPRFILGFLILILFVSGCTEDPMSANDQEEMEEEEMEQPELPDPGEGMPYYRLGLEDAVIDEPVGSGTSFHALNAVVRVNGVRFGTDLDAEHGIGLQFLTGLSPGTIADDRLGLFLFSDTPFEGSQEAGFFEGSVVDFRVGGRTVVIENGVDTLPILGSGARTPVHARYLPDFHWYGVDVAAGVSPDVSFVLSRAGFPWRVDLIDFSMYRNDFPIHSSGGGVSQEPFGYLFVWVGEDRGDTGLLVISSRPFDQAEPRGTFVGSDLVFLLDDDEYLIALQEGTMLGDGGPTTAYIYHDPGFVLERNPGEPDPGITVGISSDLASILDRDASGR